MKSIQVFLAKLKGSDIFYECIRTGNNRFAFMNDNDIFISFDKDQLTFAGRVYPALTEAVEPTLTPGQLLERGLDAATKANNV